MVGITCEIKDPEVLKNLKLDEPVIAKYVQSAAGTLARIARTKAPKRTGALRVGIIPSPSQEKTAYPGKVVYDVFWDAKMNDTFVKYSKSGKRYYYPASQEYGFLVHQTSLSGRVKHIPGKFFMSDSLVEYVPAFSAGAEKAVEEALHL